ncbi:hypothetical protein [Burkholderia ubonensis]|uniref:hypothetical protein n=1 Tax=Burkholderia ubonensis TaxID=101571 RepID=UPI000A9E8153|nr:hypothetical protein [Burkholderia ubonensis]
MQRQFRIAEIQARVTRYSDVVALLQALGGGWWNRADVREDGNAVARWRIRCHPAPLCATQPTLKLNRAGWHEAAPRKGSNLFSEPAAIDSEHRTVAFGGDRGIRIVSGSASSANQHGGGI